METLIEKEEGSDMENEHENDSADEKDENWNINYNEEKKFWDNTVLKNIVYIPEICENCKKNTYRVYTKKKPDILNPYYIKCINKNCQKKSSLRAYSFLKFAKQVPASIVYDIILLFIIEKKNGKEIEACLKKKYDKIPNYLRILAILDNIRKLIAEYLKYQYKLVQIGGAPEEDITVALDETLITHESGNQVWLVGAIETHSKKIRLDIVPSRDSENLKIFVQNHILPGTNITHDGWAGYNFLNDEDSVWTHETHNHGRGDFGHGIHSTSHIEAYWAELKRVLKKIYPVFPHKGCIYYIREAEFRTKIGKMKDNELISLIFKILSKVYKYCSYEFSDEDEIKDFANYDY